ncbi:MAG TPA: hypothetical protein VFX09_02000 [Burkholderiales bacterium]|nr:hypothetical protein [Burkholderiales bacterium]
MLKRIAFAVLLAFLAWPALAQLRSVPADAKSGLLKRVQGMRADIDGKPYDLAPGIQIRDTANRIVVPNSAPTPAKIKYRVDPNGYVSRIWVLTSEEAKTAGEAR